jgi:hypothetical protein
MTQAQLEILARSNPVVAKRMKEGYYRDRLRDAPGTPGRGPRKPPAAARPQPPKNKRSTPAAVPKTPPAARSKPAKQPRAAARRKAADDRSATRQRTGFLGGLLGGG